MKLVAGQVVDGRIVVEGEQLVEGALVAVLAPDGESAFRLDAKSERELLEAVAEADRGELVSGEHVLRTLRKK